MFEGGKLTSMLADQIARLQKFYGPLQPPPDDPFMLFVWEVLSMHATSRKRDAAYAALKRHRLLTPDAMWRAPRQKLESSVLLAGPYFDQRLRALQAGVDVFRSARDLPKLIRGPLTTARRALRRLPQIGEGTPQRMLLFASSHAVLPVDARVRRVGVRLGYGKASADLRKTSRSVQIALAKHLPRESNAMRTAFLYLSHHGAATCTDADPHCGVCPLADECLFFNSTRRPVA